MPKYRPKTIQKLGVRWFGLWRSDGLSQTPFLDELGETFASMASHAAGNGVSTITIRLSSGDAANQRPWWEVRPGEFNWADGIIARDGNGDIVSTLYNSSQVAPANSNIKMFLDECWSNKIGVQIELLFWEVDRDRYAYKLDRLNAVGNMEMLGAPGWMTGFNQMWTNANSISAYKNRIDAWLNSFGDHEGVECISLGNEPMFTGDVANFQDWIQEMSQYLWDSYGAHKPFITVSSAGIPWSAGINLTYGRLQGGRRRIDFHNFDRGVPTDQITLAGIKEYFDDAVNEYGTYSFGGQTRKWSIRRGSGWGFGAGPTPVDDFIQDINIQGDPVAHTYAYRNPPNDTVSPYPHERMYCFLAMVLDPTFQYLRWLNFIDGGDSNFHHSMKRLAEIMRVAKDFYDNALFHDIDMARHEISSSGTLNFEAALLLPWACLTFVLVGAGSQVIDFGAPGRWRLVTYRWEGNKDDWERIIDDRLVNAKSVIINFDDYTDGFCPGFLLKNRGAMKTVGRGTMRGILRGMR